MIFYNITSIFFSRNIFVILMRMSKSELRFFFFFKSVFVFYFCEMSLVERTEVASSLEKQTLRCSLYSFLAVLSVWLTDIYSKSQFWGTAVF